MLKWKTPVKPHSLSFSHLLSFVLSSPLTLSLTHTHTHICSLSISLDLHLSRNFLQRFEAEEHKDSRNQTCNARRFRSLHKALHDVISPIISEPFTSKVAPISEEEETDSQLPRWIGGHSVSFCMKWCMKSRRLKDRTGRRRFFVF